tara:strand:+ start:2295 stop:2603 length:309 start_codon:yes stop_codon:yes gene_type:complete
LTIQPNSLAALDSIAGTLTARQAEVLAVIAVLHRNGRRPCDRDIADRLRLDINQVTGRRGELHEMGLIFMAGHKTGPSGRRTAVWAPTPQQLSFWQTMGVHR